MSKIYFQNFLLLLVFLSAQKTTFAKYYPGSCADADNLTESSIIQIQVKDKEPFFVKCNEYGGWTIVLNRFDGSKSFNCEWNDCVKGFGNINQEFFIGLQKLHDMTTTMLHELMFVMEDFDNDTRIASYNAFAIEDESNAFAINLLGDYKGTAGDSFTYHSGQKFSTLKKDFTQSCPKERMSPGWFNHCSHSSGSNISLSTGSYTSSKTISQKIWDLRQFIYADDVTVYGSNIFGHYLNGTYSDGNAKGMYWSKFRGPAYSLKSLTMYIRPRNLNLD